MHKKKKHLPWLKIAFLGLVSSAQLASAQYFTNAGYGDLIGGFRKTGSAAGNYELVVNLGNVSNLLALSAGTTITMSNIGGSQLRMRSRPAMAVCSGRYFRRFNPPPRPGPRHLAYFRRTRSGPRSRAAPTRAHRPRRRCAIPTAASSFWIRGCGHWLLERKPFRASSR